MANSAKGAGNFLGPLFIVATLVVIALTVTFMISDEEIPDQSTIIAEDDIEARPAGAGTVPETPADPEIEGIEGELDEVEPAAPGEDSVPSAEGTADAGGEAGNGEATENAADQEPVADEAAAEDAAPEDAAIVDAESGDGQTGDGVSDAASDEAPAGRDAQTELSPEDGQDVVEDTDDGGTAFVPTPSGPEGQDGETIAD